MTNAKPFREREKDRIKDEAWDFHDIPQDQLETCLFYEQSIESIKIKDAVQADKNRINNRRKRKADFIKWCASHPLPSPDNEDDPLWCEYLQRMQEASPLILATTKLSPSLHFLINCPLFPKKHWLEIPMPERITLTAKFSSYLPKSYSTPLQREKRPMIIRALEDVMRSAHQYSRTRKHPMQTENYVISFFEARSNQKLLNDFKLWLEKRQPVNEWPVHKTKFRRSNITTTVDSLKQLGAFRLMSAYGGNYAAAQRRSYLSYDVERDKPLYKNAQTWKNIYNSVGKNLKLFESKSLIF